ncbi:tRNA(Ile)-lysidine synthase [Paramixta manurensis]|uniref:tRNA(Ile)-lysidine synthase n=1 Tax=Paramixta manurensis TaxID=2740817 RepID=A0A6M8UKF4_9GAMM|nr:tRNA(Ile)-lysidine synthase [Erwiniaceae bacterium PD-1]
MSALAHLEQQLAGQRQCLLAYSGGLDSTVLLHQLVQLRQRLPDLQLRAIHIHHGLSPSADSWVAHCQQQCAAWQVPLVVDYVQLDTHEKGVEAAAREARYAAFRRHLLTAESLITAQHLDDQCETFLLALKRGSGPAGLAAMPQITDFDGHLLVRPLLTQPRQQLEQWAQEHALRWIEDESNQDTRYDRNFLRQRILPQMTARWPHFAEASARSAALCAEQENLIDELLAESLTQLIQPDGSLCVATFPGMSEARRSALLRRWVAACGGNMPSRDALQRLYREVIASREDAAPRLRLGAFEIRRYRGALYWLALQPPVRQLILAWPDIRQPLDLPESLGQLIPGSQGTVLRLPEKGESVSVRFQAQGHIQIVGRAGSRPVKKIWQELAIPPWQRERTPLIFYGEQLVAAPGIFVTRFGEAKNQVGWHVSWRHHNGERQ